MPKIVTETRRQLSEIASPDEFEALATAVLRAANPVYGSLIHVGTNVDGRAVRSPVDGIGLRVFRKQRQLLLAHHTITAKRSLRHKWLKPLDGDLAKAKAIHAIELGRGAVDKAVLALTSSVDPDEQLIRDVHAAAAEGLEIDLWPGSRIADFLDRDPEGQWLREQVFGVAAARLSPSQARQISQKSLDAYLPLVGRDDIVARGIDDELADFARKLSGVGFVVGESGLGKSSALRRLADARLAEGHLVIVLDHETIEQSATIEQAVATGLRRWAPSLDAACGAVALGYGRGDRRPLLIVEDINRSSNPQRIVERLLGWSVGIGEKKTAPSWRLLCPVWRRNSGLSERQVADRVLSRSIFVDRFERSEAINAVRHQAGRSGVMLTSLQCDEFAAALGDDPLLIGLNPDWSTPSANDAVRSYVAENITAAANASLLASDLRQALEVLAEAMIERRDIAPSWVTIKTWFANEKDTLGAIRRLVDQGRVIGLGADERLIYRHDRVRDALLADAVERMVATDNFAPNLWSEPFYADYIGIAFTRLPGAAIAMAEANNPAALFVALQNSSISTDLRGRLIAAATRWTESPPFREESAEYQRYHALGYLAKTDGSFVIDLAGRFPNNFGRLEALVRNGNASAAAAICSSHEPGAQSGWRDRVIDHALARHPDFVSNVSGLLGSPNLSAAQLEGVLNLVGEIGDPALCEGLAARWQHEGSARALSSGWLWAALRCCSQIDHPLLGELCEAWAKLPTKQKGGSDERDSNPRWDIAGYTLPWALSRKPIAAAITFLIELARKRRGLEHIVTTIVSHVDLPEAVLWTARRLAKSTRRAEKSEGVNLFGHHVERLWSPDQHGRALSAASRDALEAIWRNRRLNRFDRKAAFSLWRLTPSTADVATLPALEGDAVLADAALRTRLATRDRSAISLLSARLEDPAHGWHWWYQARRIGLGGLHDNVRRFFERRRANSEQTQHSNADHIVAQLLMDERDAFAIDTIVENWDALRTSSDYVQAALYVATPATIALAQKAIADSGDLERMLRFVDMHWGVRMADRPGVTDLAQLQALEPYYAPMREMQHGDMHIGQFFGVANKLGELEWRKKRLDPLLAANDRDYCPSEKQTVFTSLDGEVAVNQQYGRTSFSISHWFERREKELWSRSELLAMIGEWVLRRGDAPAVALMCEALIHFGERCDLGLIAQLDNELRDVCATAITNCEYEVRRRSLLG